MKGWAAMCSGKQAHDTAFEAEVYAAKTYKDATLEAYKCPHCNMYHVGHSKRKRYKTVKYYGRKIKILVREGELKE